MLIFSALGLIVMAAVIVVRATHPPLLTWDALSVVDASASSVTVAAKTDRTASARCTNGVQADLRSGASVTRLPAPQRTTINGASVYKVELPDVRPGSYEIQLREVFNCPGMGPKGYSAPWTRVVVE